MVIRLQIYLKQMHQYLNRFQPFYQCHNLNKIPCFQLQKSHSGLVSVDIHGY